MRSVLSVVGLVVSVAGFVTFIGLIFGAWWARQEADREVDTAADRAMAAAEVADRAIRLVDDVIDRAEQDLAEARAAPPPEPNVNPLLRMTVNRAAGDLAGGVDRARDAVGIASDAMVVADAALSVFADRPEEQAQLGIRPGQLDAARQSLDATSRQLRQAQSLFGVRLTPMTQAEISQVEQALASARQFTSDLRGSLENAKKRVEDARQKAHIWALRVAVIATVVGSVGAIGQVFLFRACVRGVRRSPS